MKMDDIYCKYAIENDETAFLQDYLYSDKYFELNDTNIGELYQKVVGVKPMNTMKTAELIDNTRLIFKRKNGNRIKY